MMDAESPRGHLPPPPPPLPPPPPPPPPGHGPLGFAPVVSLSHPPPEAKGGFDDLRMMKGSTPGAAGGGTAGTGAGPPSMGLFHDVVNPPVSYFSNQQHAGQSRQIPSF